MTLPTDTIFSQQWHLYNTTAGQYDLDVVKVWDDYTGKGVNVVVMDSGIDYTHSDIAPNYDTVDDHDYGQGDADPSPANTTANESHGTAVAGIIGAARNGTGAVGVAYDATLIGYRIDYTDLQLDKQAWVDKYVAAVNDAATHDVDIVNMSFGFYEMYGSYFTSTQLQAQVTALDNAVDTGRHGLGTIMVKAAGNERGDDIDVNVSEVRNDTRQIIVGAVNQDGGVSSYSTYGSALLVSAFGSPANVVTTDRTGTAGYTTSDFTYAFNGTSAATPMVSGIVALMLEANPDLGWRDVQTILAVTARHVGSPVADASTSTISGYEKFGWHFNGAGNWNGGGMHFSEDYGYGLVDALAAVRMAEQWHGTALTSTNEASTSIHFAGGAQPDPNFNGTTYTQAVSSALTVERVTVTATLDLDHVGDLDIYIKGPDGLERELSRDAGAAGNYTGSYHGTFTFQSQAFRGMSSTGDWSVIVVDDTAGGAVSATDITVSLYGSRTATDNTYYYTNEFSDYAGTAAHSATLRDTNGGVDTLNASVVTSSMTVDLTARTGKIDGVALSIIAVENVYGGDGSDHIAGNKVANILSGGRGKDYLAGAAGADTFLYHVARDSRAGTSHDIISDFTSVDTIDLSDIDTGPRAGDQAFRFISGKAFTGVMGQLDFTAFDRKGTTHDMTMIYADMDGDKHADFQIELTGLHKLTAGDFLL